MGYYRTEYEKGRFIDELGENYEYKGFINVVRIFLTVYFISMVAIFIGNYHLNPGFSALNTFLGISHILFFETIGYVAIIFDLSLNLILVFCCLRIRPSRKKPPRFYFKERDDQLEVARKERLVFLDKDKIGIKEMVQLFLAAILLFFFIKYSIEWGKTDVMLFSFLFALTFGFFNRFSLKAYEKFHHKYGYDNKTINRPGMAGEFEETELNKSEIFNQLVDWHEKNGVDRYGRSSVELGRTLSSTVKTDKKNPIRVNYGERLDYSPEELKKLLSKKFRLGVFIGLCLILIFNLYDYFWIVLKPLQFQSQGVLMTSFLLIVMVSCFLVNRAFDVGKQDKTFFEPGDYVEKELKYFTYNN